MSEEADINRLESKVKKLEKIIKDLEDRIDKHDKFSKELQFALKRLRVLTNLKF